MAERTRWSIAAKLVALVSTLSVMAMIALTVFMYNGTVNVLLNEELQRLSGGVDAAATRWQTGVDFYRQDVTFLSKVPPISGIARAQSAGGVDQTDGSTEKLWKSRLETIFVANMIAHPEYIQVRFIGVDNGGKEIVRVDRARDGSLRTVPDDELQVKADRPYFSGTLALADGQQFLSKIDLNQEFGTVETPYRPVMRVATKAFDASGLLIGIVVINLSMREMVGRIDDASSGATSYITNEEGEYLSHPDATKTYGKQLGTGFTIQGEFPVLATVLEDGSSDYSGTIEAASAKVLAVSKRIYFDPVDPNRFITLTQMSPVSGLAGKIDTVRNDTIILAALILIAQLAAVIWMSVLLTRPLREMTTAARIVAAGGRSLDLKRLILRRDEAGDLARAFDAMVYSVTEKEQALDLSAQQLMRSNQDLSQFAYIASHDLQEPLRMVGSFLTLLQRRYADQLNDEAQEFVGFAVDGAARMKSLINDLLGYSRISNAPLHVSSVDLADTIAGIIQLIHARIAEADATITIGEMPRIQADAGQIERLFRNLIENALKYRSEAAPEISVSAERQGELWAFAIADNGIGIEPANAEKVFAIFTRLHSRDKYQGTGIGLAACRRIVERHGGAIYVEVNPKGGSIFRFTLSTNPAALENVDGEQEERTTN